MATSKTLTPTNVTIQIPAFTDQPDQRVNSNCIDKEADAINALNTQIATLETKKLSVISSSVSANGSTTLTITNNARIIMVSLGAANNSLGLYEFATSSSGAVYSKAIASASNITITSGTNSITITNSTSSLINLFILPFWGTVS